LKLHLIKFKEILFSDLINLNETNDDQSISLNTQDSIYNNNNEIDDKPKTNSIRILFKNSVEKEFDDLFGKNGELFATIALGDARLSLGNLSLKLKTIIQDKSNINDYSTWFSSTFRQQNRVLDKSSIHELEIPGQYTSKKKPLLEHHIKIVGFDEKLLILHSLRLPKRLTIRGHDENDYRFLVKGGEDIRQDQRIEALFSIMNDLYDNDPNCNQSNSAHIAVRTYKGKEIYVRSRFDEEENFSHSNVIKIRYD
jgi:DNA-dependent protein kinase catalytic subunit